MKKSIITVLGIVFVGLVAMVPNHEENAPDINYDIQSYTDSLRHIYSRPASEWPAPNIDSGVRYEELAVLPSGPIPFRVPDSLRGKVNLGHTLFFDPRLSGSGQIACASCHVPDLAWSDGRERSWGHDLQVNNRNAQSLLNIWYFKTLFWDGRSHSLEDQAFGPINNPMEMNSTMPDAVEKIRSIKGYDSLFVDAFGKGAEINPETLTEALATFERTIVGRKSDFDKFLLGDTTILTDAAVRGLHLFRTKARCMNCHNGPLLTDQQFHNLGLTYYGREYEDLGRYMITKKAEDVGKFRTPSLRDVMKTGPWMHNGLFGNIDGILNMYNVGMPSVNPKEHQKNDPLFPKKDVLLKPLQLTKQDKLDLIAFMESISEITTKIRAPKYMPK